MKKYIAVLVAISAAAVLAGCAAPGDVVASGKPGDAANGEKLPTTNYTAEVLDTDDATALLAVDNESGGTLCFVSTDKVNIVDANGAAAELDEGQLIAFASDGNVLETYPSQMSATEIVITGEGNGLFEFYLDVIEDLCEEDSALNDNIKYVSFDFSECPNLTDIEKEGAAYLTSCEYKATPLMMSYEELCENGYIDEENLYFPDGILLSVTVDEDSIDENSFKFDCEKWRSGLGAIFYTDCTAKYIGGEWDYTVGAFAVS